ncbi:uncharacterized protein LOC128994317 [Macrosteles quadrilineatus]|uniref:uncharacterized protein LOC128994317 n=1 Tax=Macrosteles quadrilineatus TaxID=74068 RepID=UPI0023E1A6D6|nr:uncharacterized protein LOC128994317 [Macrosteles quadrilineatus]
MNYPAFFGLLVAVSLSLLTGRVIYRYRLDLERVRIQKATVNHLRNEGTSSHGVTTKGANTDTPFAVMTGKVYKVDAFEKDDKGKKLIAIAATKKQFKMACLPLPEARQHCATKTKETHLHYVELLEGPNMVEAYCTSDPSVVLDNVKHLCSRKTCDGDECKLYLFKIRVNKEDKEECKIKSFASVTGGFQKRGEDDCPTLSQRSKLLDECEAKDIISPEDAAWSKEANIESLCKVEDAPATNSATEPAPDAGTS